MNSSVQPSRTSSLYFSILFLSVLLFSYSSAQITIPQTALSNLLTVGTSINGYSSNVAPRTANIGKRGGPTVYDFSGYVFEQTGTLQVYSVGSIPALAARYPSKAVVFGPSATDIENNPIFLFGTDTIFVVGEASLTQQRRFYHNRPYEPTFVYPITYPASRTYTTTHYDTVYNVSGSIASTNVSIGSDSTSIDGFGTLKFLGRQFECLRAKVNHYTYSDKEFMFFTREGVVLVVSMASSQRDTGLVQPTGVTLLVPSSIVSVGQQAMMPAHYTLDQNYPNPFNPTTTISFNIPAQSFVSLKVFDALGREVSVLVGEELSPGTYSRQWNAVNAPSGLYFYRLQAGEYLETKKMILLR
ncbi:MAG: T9SS type A sorting domain-containing protein [Ignavibacteriales bacterium]|nr:T9SS type A sorting domain-containing protein [Ignavibacteriales bacterium]